MCVAFDHDGLETGVYLHLFHHLFHIRVFAEVFKREGVFNSATAQRFRDCILSKGGTENPMTLYKRFKGSEPTIDALLKRTGVKAHPRR